MTHDFWHAYRIIFYVLRVLFFFSFYFIIVEKTLLVFNIKTKPYVNLLMLGILIDLLFFFISRFLDRFLTVQVICISLKSYKYIAVAGVRAAALVNKLGGRGRRRYYQRLFIYPFIYRRWLTKRNNFISVSYNILYHNRVNYIQSDKMKKYEYYLHATL